MVPAWLSHVASEQMLGQDELLRESLPHSQSVPHCTHSPPTGGAFNLDRHKLDGLICRQTTFLSSTPYEALQLIYKGNILDFFILFKALFL